MKHNQGIVITDKILKLIALIWLNSQEPGDFIVKTRKCTIASYSENSAPCFTIKRLVFRGTNVFYSFSSTCRAVLRSLSLGTNPNPAVWWRKQFLIWQATIKIKKFGVGVAKQIFSMQTQSLNTRA